MITGEFGLSIGTGHKADLFFFVKIKTTMDGKLCGMKKTLNRR